MHVVFQCRRHLKNCVVDLITTSYCSVGSFWAGPILHLDELTLLSLSRSCPPVSLSASPASNVLMPGIHKGGLKWIVTLVTSHAFSVCLCILYTSMCSVTFTMLLQLRLQALNGNINANEPFNAYKQNLKRERLLTCGWMWMCLWLPLQLLCMF